MHKLTSPDGSKGVIVTIAEGEPTPEEKVQRSEMIVDPDAVHFRTTGLSVRNMDAHGHFPTMGENSGRHYQHLGRLSASSIGRGQHMPLFFILSERGPERPRVIWPRRVYRQLSKFNNPQALRRARNR